MWTLLPSRASGEPTVPGGTGGDSLMQPDAILQRFDQSDQGTFSFLAAGGLFVYAGELPWRKNAPNISCVPAGTYLCIFTHSSRFGRRLYLLDRVRGRSGIRVHPANFMGDASKGWRSQLNGCIALGEKLGWMGGQKAVLLSGSAVRRMEEHFGGKPFVLEIRDPVYSQV